MTKWRVTTIAMMVLGIFLPGILHAQDGTEGGLAGDIASLHAALDNVYDSFIPRFGELQGVAQGFAGFAATLYIAVRVWRHIARAEPVDVYPLLRPFALGLAIVLYPGLFSTLNFVLQPTVTATQALVTNSDQAVAKLLQEKEDAVKNSQFYQMYVGDIGVGDREKWYAYTHPDDPNDENENIFTHLGNDLRFGLAKASYNLRNTIKEWMSEILQILFEAAALCINTIRTFYRIILAIIGPLVLGFSVFDGFGHSLTNWLAKYINVFLWLPIANILGSIIGQIQEIMISMDIKQIQVTGDTFFSSADAAYLIFLLIGIVCYFTVPSIANYIINPGGGSALASKTTAIVFASANSVTSTVTGAAGAGVKGALGMGGSPEERKRGNDLLRGHVSKNSSGGTGGGGTSGYMREKLSGKPE